MLLYMLIQIATGWGLFYVVRRARVKPETSGGIYKAVDFAADATPFRLFGGNVSPASPVRAIASPVRAIQRLLK